MRRKGIEMATGGRGAIRGLVNHLLAAGMATALAAGALAIHEAPAGAAKGDCPSESGARGNWSYFADSTGWTVKPKDFDILPRNEKNDPNLVAFYKQSVVFEFSLPLHAMLIPGPAKPQLMLYINAFDNPPADILLWIEVDGKSILERPVPAAGPDGDRVGVYLAPAQTVSVGRTLEKGKAAEFWFATPAKSYIGVGVELNGFTAAWARAQEVYAKSAAEAKAGRCDSFNWLKD